MTPDRRLRHKRFGARRAAAAIAVVASGLGSATPAAGSGTATMPEGAALQRALVGLWCNSNDGGRSCWAWDEFRADGRFAACGRTDDDPLPFHGEGVVEFDGTRMCYVVTAARGAFWLPPGARYCTDIVAVDERTHRYRDIDTGREYTLYRREASEKSCPQHEPDGGAAAPADSAGPR